MSHLAAVITCSDRAFADVYADRSGPVAADGLTEAGFTVASTAVVPDDVGRIQQAIRTAVDEGARVVLTTGGTGVNPTDVTVEATRELLLYEVPGLMEEVRRYGAQTEPRALLSRGVAGVLAFDGRPRALVVNAPGSRNGVRDTIAVVGPLLDHVVSQLDRGDH